MDATPPVSQAPSPAATTPEPVAVGSAPAPFADIDPGDGFDEPVASTSTPASPEPEKPALPKHSPRVLRMAKDLELADDYVQSLAPDALEEVVYQLNRQALQHARQQPKEAAKAPEVPAEEPIDWGTNDTGEPLTEKDFHPTIAKFIKSDAEKQKKLTALEKEVQESRQRDQTREQQRLFATIDSAFDALGPKYEKLIGKGPGKQLAPQSPEMKRRLAILRSAGVDPASVDAATLNRLVKASADELFAPAAVVPEEEDKEVKEKKERWKNAGLAVPTQRAKQEPAGENGAKKAVASILRERGFDTQVHETDEDEAGLPE